MPGRPPQPPSMPRRSACHAAAGEFWRALALEPELEPEPEPMPVPVPVPEQLARPGPACGGPGFLVIGAGRSATSSLYRYLLAHPQVVGARQKQLQFWGAAFAVAADPARSLQRYVRDGFPKCGCRQGGSGCANGRVAGEASPSYLADPRVPAQLARYMPGLKILVVLREPAERCFSSYRHNYLASLAKDGHITPIPFATMARWEIEHVLAPCFARYSSSSGSKRFDLPDCYR